MNPDWTDSEIINSILDGRDDGIVHLYSACRQEFYQWASIRYHSDRDMVRDAFHDAILALRFNIVHGRFTESKSTLKTYLFAIGKNQLINRLKKTRYELSSDDLSTLQHQYVIAGETGELNDRQEMIRKMIRKMEEPCYSILQMFYYLGFSMDVIAHRLNYKSEDVAKSQKARCMKKIRGMLMLS